MSTPDTLLADLRRLHEAATPGPWQCEDRGGMAVSIIGHTRVPDLHWNGECHYLDSLFFKPDMKLCAAMRTALPALLTRLEAAERLERAAESLRDFVGVMAGRGADAIIPETLMTPLGVPVKIGAICRDVDAAIADCQRARGGGK